MKDYLKLKYLHNGSDKKGRITIDQWRGQQRVALLSCTKSSLITSCHYSLPEAWSSDDTQDEVQGAWERARMRSFRLTPTTALLHKSVKASH